MSNISQSLGNWFFFGPPSWSFCTRSPGRIGFSSDRKASGTSRHGVPLKLKEPFQYEEPPASWWSLDCCSKPFQNGFVLSQTQTTQVCCKIQPSRVRWPAQMENMGCSTVFTLFSVIKWRLEKEKRNHVRMGDCYFWLSRTSPHGSHLADKYGIYGESKSTRQAQLASTWGAIFL